MVSSSHVARFPYDGAVTEQDGTDAALKALRSKLAAFEGERADQRHHAAFAGMAGALAVAVVVLSTGTWFTEKSHTFTAWAQPEDINWFGFVAVILVLVLAAVSVMGTRIDAYKLHWSIAWLAGLTAVCVLALAAQLPRKGDLYTAPAYWFTIVAAIGLALAHGYRGDELRRHLHS
jgi:cytochrome bd-type quinol oxidase subunit 2